MENRVPFEEEDAQAVACFLRRTANPNWFLPVMCCQRQVYLWISWSLNNSAIFLPLTPTLFESMRTIQWRNQQPAKQTAQVLSLTLGWRTESRHFFFACLCSNKGELFVFSSHQISLLRVADSVSQLHRNFSSGRGWLPCCDVYSWWLTKLGHCTRDITLLSFIFLTENILIS